MAGKFTDSAVNNRVVRRREVQVLDVNLFQFFRRLKGAVILCGSFPRYAFRSRNMSSAQYSFLRVFRHGSDLAFEFARLPDVDQLFPSLALRYRILLERPNLTVFAFRWSRVFGCRILRLLF